MSNFYDGEKIYNLTSNFKFVVGNRSSGKTFFYKRKAIDNFIKNGRKFVLMRRYVTEIDIIKENFFKDLELFYNNKFSIDVRGYDIFIDEVHCGKFISLSSVSKYKSINMSEYDLIIFDEFIPEDNRYINQNKNFNFEVESCLNIFQTIARGVGKNYREEVKFIFISNTISTSNPYFSYFGIDKLIWNGTKKFYKHKFFSFEVVNIENSVKSSEFGKFIANTNYGRYAIENEFFLDKNYMLFDKLPKDNKPLFNIEVNDKIFTTFQSKNHLYISKSVVNNCKTFSLSNDGENPCLRGSLYYNILKKMILENRVYFCNVSIKSILTDY